MIKITDNFLKPEEHKKILDVVLTQGLLEWKYNQHKVKLTGDDLDDYQFTHLFYTFHSVTGSPRHVISPQIDILIPLLSKMRFLALHRIKANLEPRKSKRFLSDWHYDVHVDGKPTSNMTTAIYYMNTCDGYTEFEDGTKVDCIANRFVKFPSNIKHRGVSQLDNKVKCVLNLNFFEHENFS